MQTKPQVTVIAASNVSLELRKQMAHDAGVALIVLMDAATEAESNFFACVVEYSLSLITWEDIEEQSPELLARDRAPTAKNPKATKYRYTAYHTAKSAVTQAIAAGISLVDADGIPKAKGALIRETSAAQIANGTKDAPSERTPRTGNDAHIGTGDDTSIVEVPKNVDTGEKPVDAALCKRVLLAMETTYALRKANRDLLAHVALLNGNDMAQEKTIAEAKAAKVKADAERLAADKAANLAEQSAAFLAMHTVKPGKRVKAQAAVV